MLVATLSRGVAGGPVPGRSGVVTRAAVGVAVGILVGELAAVVLFAGAIDRRLDDQAARTAESSPAVSQAMTELDRTRAARIGLDDAVRRAEGRRDDALVVARCEFNPTPACPETHITGVPGAGPENRTANDFLADSQRELDIAQAGRDRQAPLLDAQIADRERVIAQTRQAAIAHGDHGLGARWSAMNEYTKTNPGAMALRVLSTAFFALLSLLPLILKLWRGETTQERSAAARADRARAELDADTAVAVKRAEVRAATEILWAEQELASARLAVEAQHEIDREQQRRRVLEVLEAPTPVESERVVEPMAELAAQRPTAENLPALPQSGAVEPRRDSGTSLIAGLPGIPHVTRTAARWIRPFVPPIVASAIETTTRPLRGVRQSVEETEEIHFTLKRTHRVTVQTEESGEQSAQAGPSAAVDPQNARRVDPSTLTRTDVHGGQSALTPGGPRQLRARDRNRELPSTE